MEIAVKFININKEDVVATSCAKADLPVVQCIQPGLNNEFKFDGGLCSGSYYYYLYDNNGNKVYDYPVSKNEFTVTGYYHVEAVSNGFNMYPCISGCELSSTDPFAGY